MTLENLVKLVFEGSYLGLSDYMGLEYKEKLGNEFIGHLLVLYNVFCRIDKRALLSPDFYVPMTIRLGSNI